MFGRVNIVEELLDHGAFINDGIDESHDTPLHVAAASGKERIIQKLVNREANPDAISDFSGPVLTSAILSGSREAVQILIKAGAKFILGIRDEHSNMENGGGQNGIEACGEENNDGDDNDIDEYDDDGNADDMTRYGPLATAARFSEISMFEYLMTSCDQTVHSQAYDEALVAAAEEGRTEIVQRLLAYQHPQKCLQEALDIASSNDNWHTCNILLGKFEAFDCTTLFLCAVQSTEDQTKLLQRVWQYMHGSISSKHMAAALNSAAWAGQQPTMELLLDEFGADPNLPYYE